MNMTSLIPEGRYLARAIASTIGVTKNALPYVKITLLIDDLQREIDWYGYDSPKSAERVSQDLRTLGYQGNDIEGDLRELDQERVGEFLPSQVSIVVEHEEFKGRVSARVRWINPPRPAAPPAGSNLFTHMRAALLAHPAAPAGPPAKAAPKPRPEPAAAEDDDIPF